MKELNEEIKLTLNLMQTNIDDGAHSELQTHLYSLLEMKRDEIRRQLTECSDQRTENNQEPDRSIEAPELQYVWVSYVPPLRTALMG